MIFNCQYFKNIFLNKNLFCSLFVFTVDSIFSQTNDTSKLFIKEIVIIDTKSKAIQSSKKVYHIDSTILVMNSMNSLAELLANQSSLHIKTYGNGNIATSSLRGGNANHTAILWNGLSIQNPMLGQTDLSLIQTSVFDDLCIEHGGGSTAWGSGAIGGSIHLQNKNKFNEGLKTKVQFNYGSFESKKLNSALFYSNSKFSTNTRLYFNNSKNNYTYIDTTNKETPLQEVKSADILNKGFLQEFSFLINSKNSLNVRLWYTKMERNIPSFTQQINKKSQLDQSLRFNADWEIKRKKLNSVFRIAYFNDVLNYNDTDAAIYSKSRVHTYIMESDNNYKLKLGTLHFGINNTLYQTDTENYDTLHKLNKLAFFGGYNLSLLKSKLNYSIFLRQEFTNQSVIPFTGNSGITYDLGKRILGKINVSKSYRQPSLNDLYWKQGGNINLKPEDSKEIEGGIATQFIFNHTKLQFEVNYFDRQTNNWIIWLPNENGYWTPKNLLQVHSRGIETKTTFSYLKDKLFLKLDLNTNYILSTNTKNVNLNDNSSGKQLIYSPRYAGYATFLLQYKKITFYYNYNYTGYRFTSTDNTSWLMPYQISNLKVSTFFDFTKTKFIIFASCNNLLNKNYVVVSNSPMPLRNFEIGLSFQFTKKNEKKSL
jgi:iron complex outermembrane receptor protein